MSRVSRALWVGKHRVLSSILYGALLLLILGLVVLGWIYQFKLFQLVMGA